MCGICGVAGRGVGGDEDEALVARMEDRLRHRGPDGRGHWRRPGGGAVLGHTRLAIIDVTGGRQPFLDPERRAVLVHNGEVYNFRELRAELEERGRRFSTRSDTEVALEAWLEWGLGFLERLRGMFALALWDEETRCLLLARDRLGKKPLYYRASGGRIAFASEIKALLADSRYAPRPHLPALDRYLELLYVDGEETALAGIRRLLPGSYLLFDEEGAIRTGSYWRPDFAVREELDPEEAAEELRARFDEAVRLRLVSDVPLGALLSGGLDSSLVVAHMARHSARAVETFSVGFPPEVDERPKARAVALRYRASHHEIEVSPPGVDLVRRMAEIWDEPFADPSAVPTFLLSGFARRHVTVALGGDGGDELFAGYPRHLYLFWGETLDPGALRQRWERLVGRLARRVGLWRPGEGPLGRAWRRANEIERARRIAGPWQRLASLWHGMGAESRAALWRPEVGIDLGDGAFGGRGTACSALDAGLRFDLTSYLPGDLLVKLDMASMAHSLEVRTPFLDHVFVEFALQIPYRLRLGRGRTKDFLRRTFAADLPALVRRQGKTGFGGPLDRWTAEPALRALARDAVLAPASFSRSLFRGEILERGMEGRGAWRPRDLWTLLCLELWGRRMGFA